MRTTALIAALPLAAAAPAQRAPLLASESAEIIDGSYIVKLKSSEGFNAAVSSLVANADSVFPNLSSFAATLTEEEVETLRSDPSVSTHDTAVPGVSC